MALFISGWSGSVISLFQSARSILHRKLVGIEAGPRNHGQNLAVARVHGHDRAVAVAQRQLRRALQIVVDGQPQVLPRHRMLNAEVAHLAPVAVHNHIARSVLPAQQFVVASPPRPPCPPRRPAHSTQSADCSDRLRSPRPRSRSGAPQSRRADRASAPRQSSPAPAARCGAPR